MTPDWIGLDWGTTNARAWAMDRSGTVLDEARSDQGMGALSPQDFEPAFAELVSGWTLPERCQVIACGMLGARQGWAEAGYASVPCAPLSTPPTRITAGNGALDVHILPGLSQTTPPDVMRGEETQIAGFLALNPKFDGTIVLPGSHTKWAQISAGEVVSFRTMMTGEIFSALSKHTVLRHTLGDGWNAEVFLDAVSDGMSRPEALAARAFQLRAEGLLSGSAHAQARLSGLLVGAELADARPWWLGMPLAIVGDAGLARHYADALEAQGAPATVARGDACTLAGLKAARARLKETP